MKTHEPKYIRTPYLAYGSNLHLEQMFRRCPDAIQLSACVLNDYRLTFRGNWRGNGVADVIPCEGEQVLGGLYRVSLDDLAALDSYEGYPTLYDRHIVTVETEEGQVTAFVYRMLDHFRPTAPGDYYFGVIAEGYDNWGFPPRPLVESREAVIAEIAKASRRGRKA